VGGTERHILVIVAISPTHTIRTGIIKNDRRTPIISSPSSTVQHAPHSAQVKTNQKDKMIIKIKKDLTRRNNSNALSMTAALKAAQ